MNDWNGAPGDGVLGDGCRPAPGAASRRTRSLTALDAVLLAALAVLAFQMLGPVLSIPLHIPLNYNEGWNAVLDNRAVNPAAGPLYPPADSFVFNNYPPLGFYVVGALGRYVFGDMILAGRVTALAALLGAAALTGLCVTQLGGGRRAALAAGLILLIFVNSYFKVYVAVDDPQWLAHAVMLCGLAVLLRRGGAARPVSLPVGRVVAAALLMAAGGFIKHSLVALPLSVALWLGCVDRRAALVWVAAGAAGLAAGLGLTAALHGHAAFADVLQHRRVFRPNLMKQSASALAPLLPMAVASAVLLRLAWRRKVQRHGLLFVAIFGATAFFTGIVERSGEGVYYNAHFETLVAACLAFGLALSPGFGLPPGLRRRAAGPATLCVFAALPLICAWPWHLPRAWGDIHDRAARAAAWQPVIDRIAAADGPAGCLMMSLCWWADKPSEVDMFNLTEKSVRAGEAPLAFRDAVAGQRFAIVEDDTKSFIHRDARLRLGHDPVMPLFSAAYATVLHGPEGVVLLAPVRTRGRERSPAGLPSPP